MDTLVSNAIVPNSDYAETHEMLDRATGSLSEIQESLDRVNRSVEYFQALDEATYAVLNDEITQFANQRLESVCPNNDNRPEDIALPAAVRSPLSHAYSYAQNVRRNQGYLQNEESSYRRRVNTLREKLSNMEAAPHSYDRDAIELAMRNVEGVIPGSVYITHFEYPHSDDSSTSLRWRYAPGWARVNNAAYNRTWFHHQHVQVPIPACEVCINLNSKQIQITPTDRNEAMFRWGEERTVHPHVLGAHMPCLGDYGGPVMEAIDEGEWESVATLLKLFLSNIDDQDSAGANWSHYFIYTFEDRVVRSREGMGISAHARYNHYYWNGDGWEMKKSHDPYAPDRDQTQGSNVDERDLVA